MIGLSMMAILCCSSCFCLRSGPMGLAALNGTTASAPTGYAALQPTPVSPTGWAALQRMPTSPTGASSKIRTVPNRPSWWKSKMGKYHECPMYTSCFLIVRCRKLNK